MCGLKGVEHRPLESQLDGWRFLGEGQQALNFDEAWRLRADGVLVCSGSPKGYLVSPREFSEFTLELEWRWPEDVTSGNSGVLVSAIPSMAGFDVWPNSFEVQLAYGHAGEIYTLGRVTTFRTESPVWKPMGIPVVHVETADPNASVEKSAGEWNHLRLDFRGATLIVFVNGVEVNRLTGVRPTRGKVALQSEGAALEFRNLRIETAEPVPAAADAPSSGT
ncbi:MAG: DUF1080 domain-containing protein [Opitutales bacterium]